MGAPQLQQLKLKPSDLNPCINKISVAGGTSLNATGWINVELVLETRSTFAKVYYSKRVTRFFLSRFCCQDLAIIPDSFPFPQSRKVDKEIVATVALHPDLPKKPQSIPFEPVESNIPALKKFLLDSFEKTTFNKDQPFPKLSTPPAKIHLKPDYIIPRPAYWPATIAEHWAEEVKRSIEKDVEAGILIKVPFNEATEWCSRMVVVKKKTGGPDVPLIIRSSTNSACGNLTIANLPFTRRDEYLRTHGSQFLMR